MEPTKLARKAPTGLKAKGKRLWSDVTGSYQLRSDELDILEDVCREADLIDKIEQALASADFMVTGSQGQMVVNPLIAEARQHRATKMSLWKRLDLPDPVASEDAPSNQQRAAAQSRWASAHGAGA